MTPDESQLQWLLCARAACIQKRRSAGQRGALRARLHVIDNELSDVVELIQALCARAHLELPSGIPPLARHAVIWPD